jgi:hypothetical protein
MNLPLTDQNRPVRSRFVPRFIYSASVILVITVAAKLYSVATAPDAFTHQDPVLGVEFRSMLWGAGIAEITLSAGLLLAGQQLFKLITLLFACAAVIAYRILSSLLSDSEQACSCLGALPDRLDLPAETAANLARLLLIYLTAGTLFCFYKIEKAAAAKAKTFSPS